MGGILRETDEDEGIEERNGDIGQWEMGQGEHSPRRNQFPPYIYKGFIYLFSNAEKL